MPEPHPGPMDRTETEMDREPKNLSFPGLWGDSDV